jgi:PAS domain S-box-containing protein
MMVRFLLSNRFPLLLWWGPHFCQLYNDPYRPVLGTKHPQSMGQPASACWSEIWHIIGPLIETPYHGGPATWMEDLALEINRYGFVEETHFTVAYSPVPDETVSSGIGGVLATVHEISDKVVGERRVTVLRDLGARASEAKTAEDACAIAAETLAQHPQDIPFALLYLLDADCQSARLAGTSGVPQGTPASPPVIALSRNPGMDDIWPLADAVRTETMQVVDDLAARVNPVPRGPWVDPPQRAAVVPIRSNMAHQLAGVLVIGLSARLRFDELYASFLELATTQVATAIANARAYEAERQRAEALAELDRAKTVFFSNISHEFRTPLTLMLGPLEQALAGEHGAFTPSQREELDVVQRNGLRLLKLVNTLLDFSRIEAGRIDASYEPLDLAACTVDLASVFRSAIERAGLRLRVECPSLPEAIYVDRDMWEKIVLNLLSNAFKFTFEGEIAVSLRWCGTHVELAVRDTGIGIPAAELPHLFERFHRIRGARARTHEGTGIGLALVQELVKLHGGQITVASTVGAGTTFTLAIPIGTAHLPADRVGAARSLASTTMGAEAFVEKTLRWLPEEPEGVTVSVTSDLPLSRASALPTPACILLVDDNADMRDYVRRLLAPRWEVVAVANGLKALEVARERGPDLVLTDVMMPGLDGFALLRALRADPRTAPIPVILLSARAGEESRVEGLEAGADDYLIKPFSARELLARVEAYLKLHRLRREASAREQTLREEAQAARQRMETVLSSISEAFVTLDFQWRYTYVNDQATAVMGMHRDELLGQRVWDLFPDMVDDTPGRELRRALAEQQPVRFEYFHPAWQRWIENRVYPTPDGVAVFFTDITARKQDEEALQQYARLIELSHEPIFVWDLEGGIVAWNHGCERVYGFAKAEALGRVSHALLTTRHPMSVAEFGAFLVRNGQWTGELWHTTRDGREVFVESRQQLVELGGRRLVLETNRDITPRRQMEEALRASEERLRLALEAATAGSFDWDMASGAVVWSPEHFALLGVAPGSLTPTYQAWRDRVHPEDINQVEAALHHSLAERRDFNAEYRVVWPDGTIRWMHGRGHLFSNVEGEPVRMVGLMLDITDRKNAEVALHELNATLEQRVEERTALLALIQDVTRAANEAPTSAAALQYAVDRLCAYTGWPIGHVYLAAASGAERWVPTAIWHLDIPERWVAFQQATQALECAAGEDLIGRVGTHGQPEWRRDVATDPTFARRHAAQEAGLSTGVAWPILVGPEVAGVLECYTSELVAPNPALLGAMSQMSLQLGRAIERERAAAKVQQQQEALVQREKLAAMSTMLASVAHELNNPLASIVLMAELLGEDLRGGALAEPVAEITQAAARCERLVRQFLTLARQHPSERAVVALNTLVVETVELLAYPLRVDNVTVHLHLDDQLPPLWGDAHQLQQVLINLLTNAQQALRAAPGVREVTVTTQYDPAQHQIALSVADTGPGMPPALQARIFEPFFTTKPPGVGTGLGLPLCRSIIEAHGGTLRVASVLGHGAAFRLTLPVEAVPALTPAPPSADEEPVVRGRTILVVDDEPSLASGLARLLRRDSHIVDTVANGRLALAQLAERAYDLILCDVRMPELDGPSLYRFLERHQPELCQRLIFLTGDTLEPATREFLEQSGAPCLTKPFAIAAARRIIQRTLQGAVHRPEAPEV